MKINYRNVYILLLLTSIMFACKRDELLKENLPVAQLMVFNGVAGAGNVKASVSPNNVYWSSISDDMILYPKSGMTFMTSAGANILQATQIADTTQMLYKKNVVLQRDKFYSLYLTGTGTDVDTLLRMENKLPQYVPLDVTKPLTKADSIVIIRFSNLSYNGPKISINIQGKTSSEVSNLGYQEFSDFKTYFADPYGVNFEIRNAEDQSLLMTYGFNADYFKFRTVEVVIAGKFGQNIPFYDRYGVVVNRFF